VLTCLLQVNYFQGVLAGVVADAVVKNLVRMQVIPESFRLSSKVALSRVKLSLQVPKLVGRTKEVPLVGEALTGGAGAAVLVGGPGEGKSTVALEVAWGLCKQCWFPGGAFVIDFAGAFAFRWMSACRLTCCFAQFIDWRCVLFLSYQLRLCRVS
jgi:hypothetical protein